MLRIKSLQEAFRRFDLGQLWIALLCCLIFIFAISLTYTFLDHVDEELATGPPTVHIP